MGNIPASEYTDFLATVPKARLEVPSGKVRICIGGFGISHHTARARAIADGIQKAHPDKYETWYYFDTFGFRPTFIANIKTEINDDAIKDHNTSPLVWLEMDDGTKKGLGGRDKFCEWAQENFKDDDEKNKEFLELTKEAPEMTLSNAMFDNAPNGTAATEVAKEAAPEATKEATTEAAPEATTEAAPEATTEATTEAAKE